MQQEDSYTWINKTGWSDEPLNRLIITLAGTALAAALAIAAALLSL